MPPPKNIHVDPHEILRAIRDANLAAGIAAFMALQDWRRERRDYLEASRKEARELGKPWGDKPIDASDIGWPPCNLKRDMEAAMIGWIPYSLETFSGQCDLSPSEKQAWRAAVRELKEQGLVETIGGKATAIRLTDEGRAICK